MPTGIKLCTLTLASCFSQLQNIDGRTLLNMTTDQLTKLVSVVEGPILRLCDLVQQVKACGTNFKDLGDTRHS